jgi:hypothetical protein
VYDAFLIALAALLGLALGFVSIYLVQTVVAARYGRPVGWALAWAALVLSGCRRLPRRFQRWNSWEVLTEPTKIAGNLLQAASIRSRTQRPIALSTCLRDPLVRGLRRVLLDLPHAARAPLRPVAGNRAVRPRERTVR